MATAPLLDGNPTAGVNSLLDFDAVMKYLADMRRKSLFGGQPMVVEGVAEQGAHNGRPGREKGQCAHHGGCLSPFIPQDLGL